MTQEADAATDTTSAVVTETAPEEVAQGVETSEVSPASQEATPDNSSPEPKTGKDEILEIVNETIKPAEPEAKPETEAPKQDEPEAEEKDEAKDSEVLSQESSASVKIPNEKRPEWQKLVSIGDKLGKAAGKEVREVLRDIYRKEAKYVEQIEKSKPAMEVFQEIHKSVGGNEVGIANIRQLIRDTMDNPEATIAPLGMLLMDGVSRSSKIPDAKQIEAVEKILNTMKERAGMVFTNPDRLKESRELDEQLRQGLVEPDAVEKRKAELLKLERAEAIEKQSGRESERIASERKAIGEQEQNRTQQRQVEEINKVESNWVETKTKSDPDFAAVQNLFSMFVERNSLEFWNKNKRLPSSAEVAPEILEKSLKMAKAEALKFRPKPEAKKPVTNGSHGSSAQHRQQPKNSREEIEAIVQEALDRSN